MTALVEWYRRATKRRFIRYGLPFLAMVLGGAVGLKQFTTLRYQFSKKTSMTFEEAEKLGVKMKKDKRTLEDEYAEYKSRDLDNWTNIRGPRPWEDSKSVQDAQRIPQQQSS